MTRIREEEEDCAHTTLTLSSFCDKADKTLFDSIITNSTHPLHILLPLKVQKHYFTRPRGHCYELPRKTSALDENNFFYRMLYRDILSFNSAEWFYVNRYIFVAFSYSSLSVRLSTTRSRCSIASKLTITGLRSFHHRVAHKHMKHCEMKTE